MDSLVHFHTHKTVQDMGFLTIPQQLGQKSVARRALATEATSGKPSNGTAEELCSDCDMPKNDIVVFPKKSFETFVCHRHNSMFDFFESGTDFLPSDERTLRPISFLHISSASCSFGPPASTGLRWSSTLLSASCRATTAVVNNANHKPNEVASISFYSIVQLTAHPCLLTWILNSPHRKPLLHILSILEITK